MKLRLRTRSTVAAALIAALLLHAAGSGPASAAPLLPEHMTPAAVQSIDRGLAYLARTQSPDGSWRSARDGSTYPVSMTALAGMAMLAGGNTPSRGPYADEVRRTMLFLMSQALPNGLIAGPLGENGQPMYGHGFSLLFLATVYGMESDPQVRERLRTIIERAIDLTARAQSQLGGWTYQPGMGDEGSVTVTQMQALRAANDAGFTVPPAVIQNAIGYLERCRTPDGGIRYSFHSGPQTRLPISAAAITCLYSAGEFESPLADACLTYVFRQFEMRKDNFSKGGGHDYYAHLYAAQSFYQAGHDYWSAYFPAARDQFLKQQTADGSWTGDGVGPVYGTSIALIVLQLPYKYLPIYQR